MRFNVLFQKCEEWTSGFSQVCQTIWSAKKRCKDIFSVRHEPNRKNILIEISQKSMGELKFTHSLARNCPPSQFSHISWGSSKRSLIILYVTVPDHFLEREGLEEKKAIELLSECFLGHSWGMLKKPPYPGPSSSFHIKLFSRQLLDWYQESRVKLIAPCVF